MTASKKGYDSASKTFTHTDRVLPADAVVRNVYTPWVAGEPKVGWTLTVNPGTWDPVDATFTYQWLVDGKTVKGATGKTFAPSAEHVGKRVAVKVTASKKGYDAGSKRVTVAGAVQATS